MSAWKKLAGAAAGEIVWSADLANGTSNADNVSVNSLIGEYSTTGMFFGANGAKLFINYTTGTVYECDLSTNYDLSTISYNSVSFSYSSQSTENAGLCFNADGTKMFIMSRRPPDRVLEFDLSTAWDLSTASYSQAFSVMSQDNDPEDVVFSLDGTKMLVLGKYSTSYSYTLSTGYDVSTASYDSVSFNFGFQTNNPTFMFLNFDGDKLYMCGYGGTGSRVWEYDLSTPNDFSTISYNSVNLDVYAATGGNTNPQGGSQSPQAIAFSADGTTMVVNGGTHGNLISFDLS